MAFSLMTTNIADEKLYIQVKRRAAREKRPISDLVRDAFRLYLEQSKNGAGK